MSALFSGAIVVAFLGGIVAALAPCCISVMLPAYFASSVDRRRALVSMTFLFAAGVAIVILPIALGAAAVGALLIEQHMIVYLVGGGLMLAFGAFMLAGGKLRLPMPGFRARERRGPLAVVSLGAFSGVASACCAPVLAGVLALSGISGSFSAALVLGVAYVFGMVFPLFLVALLWDRFNWGESRLVRGWRLRFRVLGREVTLHSTALVSGLLMLAIGGVAIGIAFAGSAMPSSGWQLEISARLQHYADVVGDWAQTVPGWITGIGLLAFLGFLAWKALGQAGGGTRGSVAKEADTLDETTDQPSPRRASVEWQNR